MAEEVRMAAENTLSESMSWPQSRMTMKILKRLPVQQPDGLKEDGLRVFGRQELLSELADLIRTGYARAYILSAQTPHTLVADYSEGRADDLWFLLTASGLRALNELDAQPDGG